MHSDFTRTLFIGKPSREQEKIYEAVRAAQEAGIREIERIREIGDIREIRGKRIDQAVRSSIARAGYGKYFTHNSGHGVGLEIHELPNLSADSEDVLRPRQVVTVEPGIYIVPLRGISRREKGCGVRIEDMVLIKEKGAEVVSRVPKDLKSMIVK